MISGQKGPGHPLPVPDAEEAPDSLTLIAFSERANWTLVHFRHGAKVQ